MCRVVARRVSFAGIGIVSDIDAMEVVVPCQRRLPRMDAPCDGAFGQPYQPLAARYLLAMSWVTE
jgi:hypothetical protein